MNVHFAAALHPHATPVQAPTRVEHSRAALSSWLLGDRVQIAGGTHAGAVAGWVDRKGRASYAYPEVTGYYLQWLAWHAACHGATTDTRRRAGAAHRWLLEWAFGARTPPTRVYLQPTTHDWRNSALFFFDLAMVLRGLASATRVGLIDTESRLVARISELLCQLVADDGMFNACVTTRVDGKLPDRWSTRRGAFLSKAASGVLSAAVQFPEVSGALAEAADETFATSLASMATESHNEAHALLYGIEGALTQPDHPATVAAMPDVVRQLDTLLAQCTRLGYVPESVEGGAMRLDVVAQAMRAAALLLPECEDAMTRSLVQHIEPGSGIPFSPNTRPRQYSVWTAMFAEQALFAASCTPRDALPVEFRLYLV
jgi:hypothetical protein